MQRVNVQLLPFNIVLLSYGLLGEILNVDFIKFRFLCRPGPGPGHFFAVPECACTNGVWIDEFTPAARAKPGLHRVLFRTGATCRRDQNAEKRVISWVIRLVIRLVMSWLHTTCHSYVMSYPLWVLSWRVYGLVCGFTSTRKATGAPHRKKVSAFAGDRHQAESKKWQVAVTLCRKWDVCVCVCLCVFVSVCDSLDFWSFMRAASCLAWEVSISFSIFAMLEAIGSNKDIWVIWDTKRCRKMFKKCNVM